MTCSACQKRRKKLQALRDNKKAKGQSAQAAAVSAILTVTDTAAQVLGINQGEDDGRDSGEEDSSRPSE